MSNGKVNRIYAWKLNFSAWFLFQSQLFYTAVIPGISKISWGPNNFWKIQYEKSNLTFGLYEIFIRVSHNKFDFFTSNLTV